MALQTAELMRLWESDPVQTEAIDYVELYVGNARQTVHFLRTALGFTPVAYAGLETGVRDRQSYVLQQGTIRFVVTAALTPESPIAEFVKQHGDSVYDIALRVEDADAAFQMAIQRGAEPIREPVLAQCRGGYWKQATIAGPGGNWVHSFIESDRSIEFFSPYTLIDQPLPVVSTGLLGIDHLVINVECGRMNEWANFYRTVLNFYQAQEFTNIDIATELSALRSKVLQNHTARIRFPINEPASSHYKSQIQEYLDFHRGAGVQHIAMSTSNIIQTVTQLRSNGVEFLNTPDVYYHHLSQRVGVIDEDLETLRDLKILVDREGEGYLLQIFTKPFTDRPTLFFEIIQRKAACGFGNGNFKALFEAIEREQASRGNL